MAVRPIPDGYHTVTPYLIVQDAARAIDFYREAFGAIELMRFEVPGGKIGHAEIKIGNSPIMLADEYPEIDILSPQSIGGSPVLVHLYVEDVDDRFRRALRAGATEVRPLKDRIHGDRSGTLKDPFGHVWTIATHKEDVNHAELRRRIGDGP